MLHLKFVSCQPEPVEGGLFTKTSRFRQAQPDSFYISDSFYSTFEKISDEQLPPKPKELLITWLTGIFVYD
jgi:hypothetical protein